MKRSIIIVFMLCGCFTMPTKYTTNYSILSTSVSNESEDDSWDKFVEALIQVESQGNDSVVGDDGRAIGCLQIHKIMVDEANRLGGDFTYEDRWDRIKSIRIFNTVQKHHNPNLDFEKACELWNPKAGRAYYNKVLANYGI